LRLQGGRLDGYETLGGASGRVRDDGLRDKAGVIKTDMTGAVQGKYDKLISEGLLLQARWGLPEDIGRAVAMLARGDIAYSTGTVINVDGGMTVKRL
jgi:hypothetical protein